MALTDDLAMLLGPQGCLTGDRIAEVARSDASGTGRNLPLALLRPATVEEVSHAMALCHRAGQPVVPQGGMTGLAGGANPRAGDIALSLLRLAGIEEIDRAAATMTLKAGTLLQTAQEAAEAAGFLFPVDLGARGSCTVGGNIATNAGGLRVVRDGMTRDNLLGLEVVMADGTVLSDLRKMVKNNTGYDLRHLFAGSEGTLGVITRAVFRLRPQPRARATALCALDSYADVLALLDRTRTGLAEISAFEAMWQDYFALNQRHVGLRLFPEPPAFAVILEAQTEAAVLESFLAGACEAGQVADALLAQSEAQARDFWTVREGHGLTALEPGLINLDISLPAGRLDDFAQACRAALQMRFPDALVLFFGHIADSNLHVAVSLPSADDTAGHEVDEIAYGLVRDMGGSVSAEHGIGTLKREWLPFSRSPSELAAMRAIKAALDPKGLLNPGKLL